MNEVEKNFNITDAQISFIAGIENIKAQKYDLALKDLEKCLDMQIKILGYDDDEVSTTKSYIALCYYHKKEYETSIDLYQTVLEQQKKTLAKSPAVAKTLRNLAGIFLAQLNYEEALAHYENSLETLLEIEETSTKDIISIFHEIGSVLIQMGSYEDALLKYGVIAELENKVTPTPKSVSGLYSKMGVCHFNLENYNKALICYKKVLGVEETFIDEYSASLIQSNVNVALCYEKLDQFEGSLIYYKKALKIHLHNFGEENEEAAIKYCIVALSYLNLEDYKNAILTFENQLNIETKLYGLNSFNVATTHENIGYSYLQLEDYVKSIKFYSAGLQIKEVILGKKNIDVALAYTNISSIYFKIKDFKNALRYINKTIEIKEELFGKVHESTKSSYKNISKIYTELGDEKQASLFLRKCEL